jgi:arsenate reductase
MGPFTLYGLKSCDTCRKARKWLLEASYDHEFHDLREDGLDIQMLEQWSERISWTKLLNTRSVTWRKLPEVDRASMTQDKAITSMLEHPTLVKRPVLVCPEFISVGFSPENYKKMFAEMIQKK